MEMPPYEMLFPSSQMHFAPSNDPCSSMVGFLGSCYLDHHLLLRSIYVGKTFTIESNLMCSNSGWDEMCSTEASAKHV